MGDYWDDDDEPGKEQFDPTTPEGRKALLRGLADSGLDMATDLLDAMEKREAAAAARAAAVAEADQLTLEGVANLMAEWESVRYDDSVPAEEAKLLKERVDAVQGVLRAQVLDDRDKADERAISQLRSFLEKTEVPEEVERQVAELVVNQKLAHEYEASSDPLDSSMLWQTYLWQRKTEDAARDLAENEIVNRPGYWESAVIAAGEANDAVLDEIAGLSNG